MTPESPPAPRPSPLLPLVGLGLLFVLAVLLPVWLRVAHHCYSHYDLGIYSQAIARLSLATPNPWLSGRQLFLFNDHFDPVLFLARPLALLLGPPWAGLAAEGLALLLAPLPLLWLWRRGQLDARSAVLLSALLLFNPSTVNAATYPVHPTTWAVAPLCLLGAALWAGERRVALLALVLLFACKEEFPFIGVVLAAGLWLRGERRFSLQVLALTSAWLLFVFVLRPRLLGPTQGYGGDLFLGLGDAPLAFLRARLTAKGMASRVGTMLLVLAPVLLWALRARLRPDPLLWALLLPMLAIRFLGMAWRHHYGAPLMAAAVVALLPLVASRQVPGWVVGLTGLLLVTTNELPLRAAARTLWPPSARSFPSSCPADPERLQRVSEGVALLEAQREGRALVGNNLFARLAARPEVYAVGGPQEEGAFTYDWVLVEKPPLGDPYPLTWPRVAELISLWRAEPGTQVLQDDRFVFLARGHFRAAH